MRQTRTAQVVLQETGIVIARIAAGTKQSVEDARLNLAAAIDATGGTRRPLLVDISRSQPLDPEVRHYYTGHALVDAFSAMGLLVEASPFGRMMGNVYLRVARVGVPTRLFGDEAQALAWLMDYRG